MFPIRGKWQFNKDLNGLHFWGPILQHLGVNVLTCICIVCWEPIVKFCLCFISWKCDVSFPQVLKPATKEKLRIVGETYLKVLSECLQTLPSYLGGQCTCTRCANPRMEIVQQSYYVEPNTAESAADNSSTEDLPSLPPSYPDDILVDSNHCMQVLRTAIIGILIFWVLITFLGGINDPITPWGKIRILLHSSSFQDFIKFFPPQRSLGTYQWGVYMRNICVSCDLLHLNGIL